MTARIERVSQYLLQWRLPSPIAPLGGRSRTYATLIVVGIAIGFGYFALIRWTLEDMSAYWDGAMRLRYGMPLYPVVADPNAPDVYRYAPWFALLWVPLTFLPRQLVEVGWAAILLLASGVAVLPLLREARLASVLLGILGGSLLFWTASRGNVHPIVIAALVHGAGRRAGPIWIALAASLKAVPIFFILPDVAARRWSRVATTIALTVILVAPMPFLGWSTATAATGANMSLLAQVGPAVWIVSLVVVLAAAATVAVRQPAYSWLAGAVAALAALPRLIFYDLTYVLVGANGLAARRGGTTRE